MTILLKILFWQFVAATLILYVLWELLKRELVQAAFQFLERAALRSDVTEISVVAGAALSAADELRLRVLLKKKFPAADVVLSVSGGIRGGVVIKAGDLLMDYSLLTRIKYLFGKEDA